MASRFSMEMIASMVDKISPKLGTISKNASGFSKKMRNQFKTADISAKSLNNSVNKFGGTAAKAGMASLAVGAALVANEYVKFDDAIFGATARFKAAEKPGTDMVEVMENLRKAAREMGATTQFSAVLMAQGLDKFALAGFNSAESIKILKSQVDLATVSGEDFMQVADISSDLLGGFGGAALDSAAKIEKLKEMNALLAVGTLSANVSLEDLFESLKKSAPIATTAGIAMQDIIAATSVLGSAGIKGSLAGTAMMNMFTRLASPTAEVAKGFEILGLNQRDFINESGGLKNIGKIFEAIGKKTEGMSKIKTLSVFDKVFGKRALAGAAVMSKNLGQLREQMIRMGKDPQKAMAQTAAFMRSSLGNRIKALSSAATEFGFKFFEAFRGKAGDGLTSLTNAILKFDVKPLVESLRTIFSILKFIFNIVTPFIPLILTLVVALKAWIFAQKILIVVSTIATFKIGGLTVATALWTTVSVIAKIATMGLGIAFAFLTSPIGLVILAVVALIAIGVLLYKNWDVVKQFFLGMWDGIKLKFSAAIDWIGNKFTAFIDYFKNKWIAVKEFFGFDDATNKMDISKTQNQNVNQAVSHSFASPQSRSVANGTTNTTNGNLNINVNAPKDSATVEQQGTMPPQFTLATGGAQ